MVEIAELVEEVRRLREDVKAGQEETSRKLARSSWKESYPFKRKANEILHRFNEDVEDKLDEAAAAVAKAELTAEGCSKEALAKIKEVLPEGRQLIAHRLNARCLASLIVKLLQWDWHWSQYPGS